MAFYESRVFTTSLRVVQALLAILILGLTGYVSNWWGSYWNAGAPSQVAFLLFCSVITLITLAYLILIPMRYTDSKLNHSGVILTIEGLTMMFWFAGFIALAVFLNNRVCFGHVCSAAKAAAAFGAFEWLAFAVTFGLPLLQSIRSRGTSISFKRDAKPAMSEGTV